VGALGRDDRTTMVRLMMMGLRLMTVVVCLRSMAACYEMWLRKVLACLRSTTACSRLGSRMAATCLRSMIACPGLGLRIVAHSRAGVKDGVVLEDSWRRRR
jgi:hypothetical protein